MFESVKFSSKNPLRFLAIALALVTFTPHQYVLGQDNNGTGPDNIDLGVDVPTSYNVFKVDSDRSAATLGHWSEAASWPVIGLHAALLPNGEVITYGKNPLEFGAGGFVYDLWDPEKGLRPTSHVTLEVQTNNNLFCSAQNLIPGSGGMLMVTGGTTQRGNVFNLGTDTVDIFDPIQNRFFQPVDTMRQTRWYPTLTGLSTGQLLAHGGRDGDNKDPVLTPEVFNPATGTWTLLTGATSEEVYGGGSWWYPRSFVIPNGKILVMPGGSRKGYYLDTRGVGNFSDAITFPTNVQNNNHLAVMYDSRKILSVRGRDARVLTLNYNQTIGVKNVPDIAGNRFWADATVLANGEVLVTGGATVNQSLNTAVFYNEIWNPDTEQWRVGASSQKARLYHSSVLLLPSGAVLTVGGGSPGPVFHLNAEVYYPHYLFNSNGKIRNQPRMLGRVLGGGSGSVIEVRASGDEGFEKFNLVIDGEVVDTFTTSTQYESYFYLHDEPVSGSQVVVEFINDVWDPANGIDTNLNVDFVNIDGTVHQTEHPNVFGENLGVPGYLEIESLYSNGYFHYWDKSPITGPLGSTIEITARGDEGTERFRLKINNQTVRTFSVTTQERVYQYRHNRPVKGDQVIIEFFNDEWNPPDIDSNLTIDKITIDGSPFETENPRVRSSNGGIVAYARNETLFSNGYFKFWDKTSGYLQMGVVDYGTTERLYVDRTTGIEKVMMIRFGSSTHSFDMGQRAESLKFSHTGDILTIEMPKYRGLCPPGHYMIFAVDRSGTPSRAAIVEMLKR